MVDCLDDDGRKCVSFAGIGPLADECWRCGNGAWFGITIGDFVVAGIAGGCDGDGACWSRVNRSTIFLTYVNWRESGLPLTFSTRYGGFITTSLKTTIFDSTHVTCQPERKREKTKKNIIKSIFRLILLHPSDCFTSLMVFAMAMYNFWPSGLTPADMAATHRFFCSTLFRTRVLNYDWNEKKKRCIQFWNAIDNNGSIRTRCKLSERGLSDAAMASRFTCTSLHRDKLTIKTSFKFVEPFCRHSANEFMHLNDKHDLSQLRETWNGTYSISAFWLTDRMQQLRPQYFVWSMLCRQRYFQSKNIHWHRPFYTFLFLPFLVGFFVSLSLYRQCLIIHRLSQFREINCKSNDPTPMLLFAHKIKFSLFFFLDELWQAAAVEHRLQFCMCDCVSVCLP